LALIRLLVPLKYQRKAETEPNMGTLCCRHSREAGIHPDLALSPFFKEITMDPRFRGDDDFS
jgi:hypothetical protein